MKESMEGKLSSFTERLGPLTIAAGAAQKPLKRLDKRHSAILCTCSHTYKGGIDYPKAERFRGSGLGNARRIWGTPATMK